MVITDMKEQIEFLIELQEQMRYENKHDYDMQAHPRFWVIMDYRIVPGNSEFDNGFVQRYWNDGDHCTFSCFEALEDFIVDHYDGFHENIPGDILEAMQSKDFDYLWEVVSEDHNEDGFYDEAFVKEEEFIVPNTLFLTKVEAKRYLIVNSHNLSPKAHTYAMTALRAPKVEKLITLLHEFDFQSLLEMQKEIDQLKSQLD